MEMNITDFLASVKNAEERLNALEVKLELLERDRVWVKSVNSERGGVSSASPAACANYEKVCDKIVDLKREIGVKRAELSDARQMLADAFGRLDNPAYSKLLVLRYVERLTFLQIADVLGYSRSHIYRLHNSAVGALAAQGFRACSAGF